MKCHVITASSSRELSNWCWSFCSSKGHSSHWCYVLPKSSFKMGNALCMFCLCSLPWHLAVAKSSGHCSKSVIELSSLNWVATIQDNSEDSVDGSASDCGYSFCRWVCLEKFPLFELTWSWCGVGRVQFSHRDQKGLHFPYIAMTSCDDQMVSFWSIKTSLCTVVHNHHYPLWKLDSVEDELDSKHLS